MWRVDLVLFDKSCEAGTPKKLNNFVLRNTKRVKKRLNFLNSSPTSKEGALRLLGAPSGRF
jgi:hypothetical protein